MSGGRQWLRQLGPLLVAGLVALGPGLVVSQTAHAAGVSYYVAVNGTDKTGDCSANSASNAFPAIGQAISCANTDTANGSATAYSPDSIEVAAGTYHEVNLGVNAYVTIEGVAGHTTINADAGHQQLVGEVLYNVGTVRISGLTITGGLGEGDGAAILNENGGTLSIRNTTISGNTSCSGSPPCSGYGGGILNEGTLSISNSSVNNNTACTGSSCTGHGGGIANFGTLSISNISVNNNTACHGSSCTGNGGGLWNISGSSSVTISGSVINNNAAYSGTGSSGDGGGIYNLSGSPTLTNDTIKNNVPDQCAGINISC